MKIHITINNWNGFDTKEVIEDLGFCQCDNINRALELYRDNEIEWIDKGYNAVLKYEIIE